ncbi:MAG: M20 family metallopeptidase [Chloroflexota bacterium]
MPTDPTRLRRDAQALQPWLVEIRRQLHRRPEVGLDLPETQRLVVAELERLGLAPRLGRDLSSVAALVEGGAPGPTVLLRADMDALPVDEATGLDFASEIDGAMHACGHDTHVAMLLGAARLLVERRPSMAGRVLLDFQPGEEGRHGARLMLDEGLLDVPIEGAFGPVTGAFAIHITARYSTGTINFRRGALYAAGDRFTITVRGAGGHAASPHLALDPVPIAAEIVLALQTIRSRRINTFDPIVLTIGSLTAGTAPNIIPETAVLRGTVRTTSDDVRDRVHELIRQMPAGIATAHGATAEVEISSGYPATINDEAVAGVVLSVATELLGEDRVVEMPWPSMGSEDFSYILQRVPGAMVFLGATPADLDPTTVPQTHSNKVVLDESAMPTGVALHVAMAERLLARG